MSTERDLLDMIEIVTTAIEIHGSEEDFFRRSSNATQNEAARALLRRIADEVGQYRLTLEARRRSLRTELDTLEADRASRRQ